MDQNIPHLLLLFEMEKSEVEYDYKYQLVEYYQNASNGSCFSTLASAFTMVGEKNCARDIAMPIVESLHCQSNVYRGMI